MPGQLVDEPHLALITGIGADQQILNEQLFVLKVGEGLVIKLVEVLLGDRGVDAAPVDQVGGVRL